MIIIIIIIYVFYYEFYFMVTIRLLTMFKLIWNVMLTYII